MARRRVLLPEPLPPMTQTMSPRVRVKLMPSSAVTSWPKRQVRSRSSRWATMLRSSSMMRSLKSQRRPWPESMRMKSLSLRSLGATDGDDLVADGDGAIGGDDFEFADAIFVIAEDLEQDFAGGAG